jgi:aryl-alcohol dehydrogenase-like predicted oxidoreductase
MDYRKLGRSGLKVSPLCLGTMMFGGPTAKPQALSILARAAEQGVNFLDTADAYNAGRSEEIIGGFLAGQRQRWVVASKVALPLDPQAGINERGLSRRWIMQAVEASLRRLGTDYIDIYYHGQSGGAGQGALLWPVQLPQLAGGRNLSPVRSARHRPPGGQFTVLQRAQSHA